MRDKEHEQIAARLHQLTPEGPWETGTWDTEVRTVNRDRDGEISVIVETANDTVREFIAHAPDDLAALLAEHAALLAIVRAVATSNPYGSWLPPTNTPAGVVCRWCMERAYSPAQCQHDQECTWRQARELLASEGSANDGA